MGLHARFHLTNRREIADEIERLIALLDAADAPFADLESEEDFGVDQSAGPVNVKEGYRAHHARMTAS